jgi:hypothetical protein
MSTEPFQELPPRDHVPGPPEGSPPVFPASQCPLPSRFWKVALALDDWSQAELEHLTTCSHCREVLQSVSAAARTSPGPVIGTTLDLPAVPEPHRGEPEPEAGVEALGWFWKSWLGQGLSFLGSLCGRLAARPAACQRQTRRERLGLDRLEDRDVLNSFFPWNAGWEPDILSADPPDRNRPVLVDYAGRAGTAIPVPGSLAPGEQAWLTAVASLVWSDAAPDAAGA